MEKFILRNNPYFEIILNEHSFEINNSDYTYKNGVYKFDEIKSVELIDKKLDWFSTLIGNVIGFFLGGQIGYEVSEAKFEIQLYSDKIIDVKLINCDIVSANKFLKKIKFKITNF